LNGRTDHARIDGGVENVSNGGRTDNTTIAFGGVENVNIGATADNTTIAFGGVLNVMGNAVHTTIGNGGLENVSSGGTIGFVTFSGSDGTLQLGSPSSLRAVTIAHWQVGDVIDLLKTKITSVSETGNSVTVKYGPSVTFTVADQQANTEVALQSDGHGGTDLILVSVVGVHDHVT